MRYRSPGNLLLANQIGFRSAQAQRYLLRIDALHGTRDQVTLAVDELIVQGVSFGFTDFLQDDLFGGLGGDASKTLGGMLDLHHHHVVNISASGL